MCDNHQVLVPAGTNRQVPSPNTKKQFTTKVDIVIYNSNFVSVVLSTRELEVVDNPKEHLNQYLKDVADNNNQPYHKMYAFAKIHFKDHIPRNKIEEIVDAKFRNPKMDHSDSRKKTNTKKSMLSKFSKLPKSLQIQALSAVAPLTESLSYFTEDEN